MRLPDGQSLTAKRYTNRTNQLNKPITTQYNKMALQITDENAREIIESGKPVIIDFWATWCGPCMAMAPLIDELAQEYADRITIGKYNVDEEGDLSSEYRIMSLPTLLFFKNGKKTDIRLTGSQNRGTLEAKIKELIEL